MHVVMSMECSITSSTLDVVQNNMFSLVSVAEVKGNDVVFR